MLEDILVVMLTAVVAFFVALLVFNLSLGDKEVENKVRRCYATRDPDFVRAMGVLLGQPLLPGNRVRELLNGDEFFPAMLDAIRTAQHAVTFETYIFWSGTIGEEFVDALVGCAQRGVRVHVLLDWIGYALDDTQLKRMRHDSMDVRRYNRPRWNNLHRLNNRTHRKLLIVDGRVGFTGGPGVADVWRGNGRKQGNWRDSMFRVEGPVVAQMQAAFCDNWTQTTGDVLHGDIYLPELRPAGDQLAQIFTGSPGGGGESVQLMYLLAITAAQESIRLSAAYFVPDRLSVRSLIAALERGVRVQIILPGAHMDYHVVRRASRACWGELLRAGAEIYEYQPSMYHVKELIIDTLWVSVGSTNFDTRSFAINDEANLNIYDADFAQQQVAVFEDDLKLSRRVSLEEWEGRKWSDKLLDRGASLLGAQL